MRNYQVDMRWTLLLEQVGLPAQDILRVAGLPLDLFQRDNASVNSVEYFRLWRAMEEVSGDPMFPLNIVTAMGAETFSPPIFAALCSDNLITALSRLKQYKPLIGPMSLRLYDGGDDVIVQVDGLPGTEPPPPSLVAGELVFFTHIARLGTRAEIRPVKVQSPVTLKPQIQYESYFGCRIGWSEHVLLTFDKKDAERPFLTASPAMWSTFEPALQDRLSALQSGASMVEKVQGWLVENIASGRVTMAEAARDLGVSNRTLQRRLSDEGTSFKTVLAAQRHALSRHYLTQTNLPTAEIAFLLGYTEQNSFYRAFND